MSANETTPQTGISEKNSIPPETGNTLETSTTSENNIHSDFEELLLLNDMEEIPKFTAFIDHLGEKWNLPSDLLFQINLALEEAVSNVIMYAFPEHEEHSFQLKAARSGNTLTFTIIDDGRPFDPTQTPDVDTTLSDEDRKIGGLGIFIAKNMMDSITYRYIDNKNVLTLTKNI